MNITRNFKRLSGLLAFSGLAAALSGCVVAPVGYDTYGGYPSGQVYVAPPPVVVAPGYYGRGYYGRGYYGHPGHRGYRGHGYWR
jgi:hypothetical protein